MGVQTVICIRRSCQVSETPAQRSHEHLETPVTMVKRRPKTSPRSPKNVALAWNNPRQARRTKQNRISWPCTPIKVRKGDPKGFQRTLQRRLQPLQNASKAPPLGVLEASNLETLIFKDVLYGIKVFGSPEDLPERPKTSGPSSPDIAREVQKREIETIRFFFVDS